MIIHSIGAWGGQDSLKQCLFVVFNKGQPFRYTVFFRYNFDLVKSKASAAFLGSKKDMPLKNTTF
jgi:hypothetical protein